MSEEMLVNVTPQETRVAVMHLGAVQELHIERASSRGLVGNIYLGRVARVLPGMQSAFIDIGLDRAAFLHVADIWQERRNGDDAERRIEHAVHEGQSLVVQVIKDPIGTKGARLTTQLTLPARYLVYMPFSKHIGISQKIEDDAERERLRAAVKNAMGDDTDGGYILRTVAETVSEDELKKDIRYLRRAWQALQDRIAKEKAPALLHDDLPLALRAMRDLFKDQVEKVRIDSRETFQRAREFAREFIPEVVERVEYYPGERPIFDLYGVEDEIQRALQKEVPLKSGGYLVIDQTEAMATIDVNTGSFLGQRNLEETVYRTNLEAAQAVARQLRLRNLGGIIIIDFIDMTDDEHRRQVLRTLEKGLAHDHARTSVHEFSPLGLVEMTRKRTTDSLERQLCEPCHECGGRGTLKTAETLTYEVFREITRAVRQFEASQLLVIASPKVVTKITEEESAAVAELEEFLGKSIRFQADEQYAQEQYDVVLL